MAGRGQGWMTKDHGRGTGDPYSLATKKIAGGIYLDLAQGNTISKPKSPVLDPLWSLLSPSLWLISPWETAK